MSDVPEQQNPPLDIPKKVDQAVLEKFGLKTDDAILAEEKDTPLSKELVDMEGSEYIAGGVTQNPIRVAQWMLQESHVLYWFW